MLAIMIFDAQVRHVLSFLLGSEIDSKQMRVQLKTSCVLLNQGCLVLKDLLPHWPRLRFLLYKCLALLYQP